MHNGFFIAFEGLEKCGKSTHAYNLVQHLREKGYKVMFTREPGGVEYSEKIRQALLFSGPICPEAELLGFGAARAQHVAEKIMPALRAGFLVITDRYAGTTLAYQGGGRGISMDKVMAVQDIATMGIWPQATVLMDIPVQTSLDRIALAKGDDVNRLDKESGDFFRRVYDAYQSLLKTDPSWIRIDGDGSVEEVDQRLFFAIERILTKNDFFPDDPSSENAAQP
jgi:thymidylate kinase